MNLLVAIASYGRNNDSHLSRVIAEYQRMNIKADIVVLSNIPKDLGPNIEVRVGLPSANPYSLPFAHKRLFVERQEKYDLFIYTEDDMLITEGNIEAFLKASSALSEDELPGFFQYETFPDGRAYYPAVHSHFRWLPESVKSVKGYVFARYSNEHTACFLLTRKQLKQAISSGGFMVEPYEGRYQMRESAATDPYTRCGFTKYVCISHFDDFLVAHLPNRYIHTDMGLEATEFEIQIKALLDFSKCAGPVSTSLFPTETKLPNSRWSKGFYEKSRSVLVSEIPLATNKVLSIGCGRGATESELIARGSRVTAIPLDPVIASLAQQHGIEIVHGDLDAAFGRLRGQKFEAVLISGTMNLVPDPLKMLRQAGAVLAEHGLLVADFVNFWRLPVTWRRLRGDPMYQSLADSMSSGITMITRKQASKWFKQANLQVERVIDTLPEPSGRMRALAPLIKKTLLSREYVLVGRKVARITR